MDENNLDNIEEDLKKKSASGRTKKKEQKVSGRSVFKLKEIIQKKAEEKNLDEKE
jgi:hypothetical protein